LPVCQPFFSFLCAEASLVMKLTWFGHAAFLIEAQGTRIILDPFRSPDSGGYRPIDEAADVVVVSHENDRYHSHLGQIIPPFEVVKALEIPSGGTTVRGIKLKTIHVFENEKRQPEDEVTIVHFRVEGLHVAFLGDLGHSLSEEELDPIRGAEVVLIAAGGRPTIGLAEVPGLLDAIGPRVVVPMHYKIEGKINLKIEPIERFFNVLPEWRVDRIVGSSFEVTSETLPVEPTIVWLEPAR